MSPLSPEVWHVLRFWTQQDWKKITGVFPKGAGPRGGLALCVAKSVVSSPSGGTIHQSRCV